MSRIMLGVICGLVFGAVDIGIMLPMTFPDEKAAITAAFIARFGIGFAIGAARLPWPGMGSGIDFRASASVFPTQSSRRLTAPSSAWERSAEPSSASLLGDLGVSFVAPARLGGCGSIDRLDSDACQKGNSYQSSLGLLKLFFTKKGKWGGRDLQWRGHIGDIWNDSDQVGAGEQAQHRLHSGGQCRLGNFRRLRRNDTDAAHRQVGQRGHPLQQLQRRGPVHADALGHPYRAASGSLGNLHGPFSRTGAIWDGAVGIHHRRTPLRRRLCHRVVRQVAPGRHAGPAAERSRLRRVVGHQEQLGRGGLYRVAAVQGERHAGADDLGGKEGRAVQAGDAA